MTSLENDLLSYARCNRLCACLCLITKCLMCGSEKFVQMNFLSLVSRIFEQNSKLKHKHHVWQFRSLLLRLNIVHRDCVTTRVRFMRLWEKFFVSQRNLHPIHEFSTNHMKKINSFCFFSFAAAVCQCVLKTQKHKYLRILQFLILALSCLGKLSCDN